MQIGRFGNCCCPIVAIIINNVNSVTDDSFAVELNGVDIGTITNGSNNNTGRIFSEDPDMNSTNTLGILGGFPMFEPTIQIDRNDFLDGVNILKLRITQVNGAGNFGLFSIGCYNKFPDGYYRLCDNLKYNPSPGLIYSTAYSYSGGAGVGSYVDNAGFGGEFRFDWDAHL